ncbi:MAG: sugar transferase [Elusimicrobiaceae bacterium]|nr:sugar transferase [Elusimicrobiaceae bacterium]
MRALFLLLDFISFFATISWVVILRYQDFSPSVLVPTIQVLMPVFCSVTLILWVFSFYDINTIKKQRLNYQNILVAFTISLLSSGFGIYYTTSFFNVATSKLILLSVFVVYFSYLYLSRKIYASYAFVRQKILLVGQSETLKAIEKDLAFYKEYVIAGRCATAQEALGPDTPLPDLMIMAHNCLEKAPQAWPLILEKLICKGVLLETDYQFYERLFNRCSAEALQNPHWLVQSLSQRQSRTIFPLVKRAIDIGFSLVLIPLFFPLGLCIYGLIKYTDKMPPFFPQVRMGRNDRRICIYKFRTMKPHTQEVTRLGAFLRRFRLDEIPQLINILRGDISIVGPRPVWDREYQFLNEHIYCHRIRNIIQPGLTGWAQLNFKAPPTYCVLADLDKDKKIPQEKLQDAVLRLAYDLWYIKNRSLFLDVEIILKTAKRAFLKDKHIGKNS